MNLSAFRHIRVLRRSVTLDEKRVPPHARGPKLCSKLDCIASGLLSSWVMSKNKKSKNESARATLASVTKEMAQPRFAGSARKEEDANHHVMERRPHHLKV